MIFAYNKEQVGDVLLVILEDTKDIKRSVERKGKVARVTADETGKTLAWNIFEGQASLILKVTVKLVRPRCSCFERNWLKSFEERLEKHKVQSLWLDKLMKWLHIQTTTLTSE